MKIHKYGGRVGEWVRVAYQSRGSYINTGDMAEILTKGKYKATPHAVENEGAGAHTDYGTFTKLEADSPGLEVFLDEVQFRKEKLEGRIQISGDDLSVWKVRECHSAREVLESCQETGFAYYLHGKIEPSLSELKERFAELLDSDYLLQDPVRMTKSYPYGLETNECLDNNKQDQKVTFTIPPLNLVTPRFPAIRGFEEAALARYNADLFLVEELVRTFCEYEDLPEELWKSPEHMSACRWLLYHSGRFGIALFHNPPPEFEIIGGVTARQYILEKHGGAMKERFLFD